LDDRVEPAADAVRRVGREVTAFDVAVQGAGAFPPVGRPRALWLGITQGAGELSTLAAAVDRALADAGWSLDPRPFRAHLTLARADGVAGGSAIGAKLAEAAADLDLRFRATSMGLFESLTGGGPARYVPVETVRLA
jgi:2'-5' RNA ligase